MKENNVMTEETSNLTKDTIWFWNEHAKPAIDWCSARWMDCYELSAGWTIGVSVVVVLLILGKILPDSDGENAPATVDAPDKVRLNSYSADVLFTKSGNRAGAVTVWSTDLMSAQLEMLSGQHQRSIENGTCVLGKIKANGSHRWA